MVKKHRHRTCQRDGCHAYSRADVGSVYCSDECGAEDALSILSARREAVLSLSTCSSAARASGIANASDAAAQRKLETSVAVAQAGLTAAKDALSAATRRAMGAWEASTSAAPAGYDPGASKRPAPPPTRVHSLISLDCPLCQSSRPSSTIVRHFLKHLTQCAFKSEFGYDSPLPRKPQSVLVCGMPGRHGFCGKPRATCANHAKRWARPAPAAGADGADAGGGDEEREWCGFPLRKGGTCGHPVKHCPFHFGWEASTVGTYAQEELRLRSAVDDAVRAKEAHAAGVRKRRRGEEGPLEPAGPPAGQ